MTKRAADKGEPDLSTFGGRIQYALRGLSLFEWFDVIIEFVLRSAELLILCGAFAYVGATTNNANVRDFAILIQWVALIYIGQGMGRFAGRLTLIFRPPDFAGPNKFLRPLVMAISGAVTVVIFSRLIVVLQEAIDAIVATAK